MASTANPVAPVSSGEAVQQTVYITGPVYYRVNENADWVKLELVDDGTDSGNYVFRQTTQSSDSVMP